MGAEARNMQTALVCLPLLFSLFVVSGCSGTLMPYESSFQCPGGYNGICESIDDAYHDSVNGIDPRQFDEKWKEHKADWEESHAELIAARKGISAIYKASETLSAGQKPASYRESYLRKMKDLIDAPETPVLVPPKVIRILVLPRTYEQNRSLVGSHYLFSQLEDGPRWILKKIPEVPEQCVQNGKEDVSGDGTEVHKSPEAGKEQERDITHADDKNQDAPGNCPSSFDHDTEDEELEWVP